MLEDFLQNITQGSEKQSSKNDKDSETRSIPENDSMKNLIGDFVESLFFEEKEEKIPQEVCDFVSSLFDNEKETTNELVDTLFETDASKSHSIIYNKNVKNKHLKLKNIKNKVINNSTLTPVKTVQNPYQKRKEHSAKHYGFKDYKFAKKKNVIRVTSLRKRKKIPNENYIYYNSNNNIFSDYSKHEFSDTVKSRIECEREKRQYEEKVRLMKNHITAMKRQQNELNKKMILLKNKEKYLNTKKKEKEDAKKIILQNKIKKQNELESKKKHTELQKNIINKGLQESTQKAKMEKIKRYKQSKLEKKAAEDKYLTILQESTNKNKNYIAKVKEERNRNYENKQKKFFGSNFNSMSRESYEDNMEKTKKLKEQLIDLEKEQYKCMENLNLMKEKFNKYNQESDILARIEITPHYTKKISHKNKNNVKDIEKKDNKLVLKKCYMKNTNKK